MLQSILIVTNDRINDVDVDDDDDDNVQHHVEGSFNPSTVLQARIFQKTESVSIGQEHGTKSDQLQSYQGGASNFVRCQMDSAEKVGHNKTPSMSRLLTLPGSPTTMQKMLPKAGQR